MDYLKKFRKIRSILVFGFLLQHCAGPKDLVLLQGEIHPFQLDAEYNIRFVNMDHYEDQIGHIVESEDIRSQNLDLKFHYTLSYQEKIEVQEGDTIRCILLPVGSNYYKNPVTEELFYVKSKGENAGVKAMMEKIRFSMDTTRTNLLDYNLRFIQPKLKVSPDYKKINAELDTLPQDAKVVLLLDGGYERQRYEFRTRDFEVETNYPINYMDIYVESRYGWYQHVRKYDLKNVSLNY